MAASTWPISAAGSEFTAKYKLPVQFDTAIQLSLTNEVYDDEDDALSKIATLPTGLLAIRIYGCQKLSSADLKMDDDILVYARVICGAMGKSTHHCPFSKGKPVWNEYLFFPVQLTGNPKSKSNKLTILIIWRDAAQDKETGVSNHRLFGKKELFLYRLAKHRTFFETVDITNRKQQVVGQLQMETALIYGPFGFGQSFQLENHLYTPEEMVQVSLYPKVLPCYDGPQCRGNAVIPRRSQPPSLIPFNERALNLEPAISETHGSHPGFKFQRNFPAVSSRMTRLPSLQHGLLQQKTRTSRIGYLRGVLRNLDKVEPAEASTGEKYGKSMGSAVHKTPFLQNMEGENENDLLQAISEDQLEIDAKHKDFHKATNSQFAANFSGDDDTSIVLSNRSTASSLQALDTLPESSSRRRHKRPSIIEALFNDD